MILLEKFYSAYTQSLGIEGSQKVVKEAISEAGLTLKKEYSKEEAKKLCEVLKSKPGFVGIIAGFLMARVILDKA